MKRKPFLVVVSALLASSAFAASPKPVVVYLYLQWQRILEDWAMSQRRQSLFSPSRFRREFLRECPGIFRRKIKQWGNGIFGSG